MEAVKVFEEMKFDIALLDTLTAQAQASPRLRMNIDLRDSTEDQSQRMLNAIETGDCCTSRAGQWQSYVQLLSLLNNSLLFKYY